MRRALLGTVLSVSLLLSQDLASLAKQAPPEVDQALRTRVTRWLELHKEGKYREAEKMVSEDSKDHYFAAKKTRYLSYDLGTIQYSDNFTKARVMAEVEIEYRHPQFNGLKFKPPIGMSWRLEQNGEWMFFVDKTMVRQTPFGEFDPNKPKVAGTASPLARGGMTLDRMSTMTKEQWEKLPDQLASMVVLDRSSVEFQKGTAGEQTVTVKNGVPGTVTLQLPPLSAGLSVVSDRTEIPGGETATLTFRYAPSLLPVEPAVAVPVRVQPLNSVLTVNVVVR